MSALMEAQTCHLGKENKYRGLGSSSFPRGAELGTPIFGLQLTMWADCWVIAPRRCSPIHPFTQPPSIDCARSVPGTVLRAGSTKMNWLQTVPSPAPMPAARYKAGQDLRALPKEPAVSKRRRDVLMCKVKVTCG